MKSSCSGHRILIFQDIPAVIKLSIPLMSVCSSIIALCATFVNLFFLALVMCLLPLSSDVFDPIFALLNNAQPSE